MTMTPSAEFRLTSTDGVRVACARRDGRGAVRGVVQIAHGVGEHIGRYVGLIEVLVRAGLTFIPPMLSNRSTSDRDGIHPTRHLHDWRHRDLALDHDAHSAEPGSGQGRHEMLNEANRDEVRTRLIGWISWVLEQRKLCTRAS
jgi:alpha-beta hydrolase superfamily lysophospholipase